MRAERAVVCLILAGCGRLGFDEPALDASAELDVPDAPPDAMPDAAPMANCTTDARYVAIGGLSSTYRHGIVDLSWAAAQADCEADGARLAIPENADEASAAMLGDWVGITDELVETEWRTIDGALATFLPWEPGQPDGGTAENCVRFDDTTLTMEDRACTDLRDYTCECE